jgi:hypothetical protein
MMMMMMMMMMMIEFTSMGGSISVVVRYLSVADTEDPTTTDVATTNWVTLVKFANLPTCLMIDVVDTGIGV